MEADKPKYLIGAGIVESYMVKSHPKLLKGFKTGDRVIIMRIDDFEEYRDDILYEKNLINEILDIIFCYDLDHENIQEIKELIREWRSYR